MNLSIFSVLFKLQITILTTDVTNYIELPETYAEATDFVRPSRVDTAFLNPLAAIPCLKRQTVTRY